jgi:hypothetical protein
VRAVAPHAGCLQGNVYNSACVRIINLRGHAPEIKKPEDGLYAEKTEFNDAQKNN